MPRIPAPLKLMQEDWPTFKARMNYRMKPCLKTKKSEREKERKREKERERALPTQ